MGQITLQGVQKSFGPVHIIKGADLDIADGSFVVFVGPSGCGKTTLLRLIAGLEDVTGGAILIDGKNVVDTPPAKRGLSMVFQSYALYPHMSVRGNIGFGLKMAGLPKEEINRKVEAAAATLNLSPYLDRKPRELSGGQRQRVAIGRAIVREPKGFLFDEPLSNLDAALRVQMRIEVTRLQKQLGTTAIYVTHDQVEAMTMADKIVVMHDGIVEQMGTPLELYDKPENQFVAGFIGSPAMNFLKGHIRVNGVATFEGPNGVKLPLKNAPAASDGKPVVYGVRPEHFTIADDGADAEIVVVEPTGSETQVFAKLGGEQVVAVFRERHQFNPGDKVKLKPDPDVVHLFDEGTGKRLNA